MRREDYYLMRFKNVWSGPNDPNTSGFDTGGRMPGRTTLDNNFSKMFILIYTVLNLPDLCRDIL